MTKSHLPYQLVEQTLCLTHVNFRSRTITGYTELTIRQEQVLHRLALNLRQCSVYRITVDDVETEYLYLDPLLEVVKSSAAGDALRNVKWYAECYQSAFQASDANEHNGELVIRLPEHITTKKDEYKIFIEFSLVDPQFGLRFIVPFTSDEASHVFTCGSPRCWFPCIDSKSVRCPWQLLIRIPSNMMAVCSGEYVSNVASSTDISGDHGSEGSVALYQYRVKIPASASDIGLAIGEFDVVADPRMSELTFFCLPGLESVMQNTVSFLYQVFEYLEELLSYSFPFSEFKICFLTDVYEDNQSYNCLHISSVNLLHAPSVIDQVPVTRRLLVLAVIEQYFGRFVSPQSRADEWLVCGIARYLLYVYIRDHFGQNEFLHFIDMETRSVCNYELNTCSLTISPVSSTTPSRKRAQEVDKRVYFPLDLVSSAPSTYIEMCCRKAGLVVRMMQCRVGYQLFLQVLNKLLSLAGLSMSQENQAKGLPQSNLDSPQLLLSTSAFQKVINDMTGKKLSDIIDRWVRGSGVVKFSAHYNYHQKRNVITLHLAQPPNSTSNGVFRYVGPLRVSVQEFDGFFNHTIQVEDSRTQFDVPCHSKGRKNRKRKVTLSTGEEVDIDLSTTDPDSPILWVSIDPQIALIRHVELRQADYMLQLMLKYSRHVPAQITAARDLVNFPTPQTRAALEDSLCCKEFFYRVRIETAFSLALVEAEAQKKGFTGPPALISAFQKNFGSSKNAGYIPRRNDFADLREYFLQRWIPLAAARQQPGDLEDKQLDRGGITTPMASVPPGKLLTFLLSLLFYNDNSKNRYSDNYYICAILDAITSILPPTVSMVGVLDDVPGEGASMSSLDQRRLSRQTALLLDQLTTLLNLEKLLPSHRFSVTVSCLKLLRRLQTTGHIPSSPEIFHEYNQPGVFIDVRIAAVECLVDFAKVNESLPELRSLLDQLSDHSLSTPSALKFGIVRAFCANPPFRRQNASFRTHPLSAELADAVWNLMNTGTPYDWRLRSELLRFYYILYGIKTPSHYDEVSTLDSFTSKQRKAAARPRFVAASEKDKAFISDDEDKESHELSEDDDLSDHLSLPESSSLSLPVRGKDQSYSTKFNPDLTAGETKVAGHNLYLEKEGSPERMPIELAQANLPMSLSSDNESPTEDIQYDASLSGSPPTPYASDRALPVQARTPTPTDMTTIQGNLIDNRPTLTGLGLGSSALKVTKNVTLQPNLSESSESSDNE